MTETTVRLHITPLTPDILPAVLPPSLRQTATDISFHTVPTFPENSYGYVTLPSMDAEKIKKKLNGSILKGKKFKVEAARPSKRERDADEADTGAGSEEKKEKKKSKKRSTSATFSLTSQQTLHVGDVLMLVPRRTDATLAQISGYLLETIT